MACAFQDTVGGTFAPPIGMRDDDIDIDTMITTYRTALTDASSEILGKERRRKKPWISKDVLDLCDEMRDFNKRQNDAEEAKAYREEDSEGSEESK